MSFYKDRFILIVILIIFLLGLQPGIVASVKNYIRTFSFNDFLIQIIAVGVGVYLGNLANKQLDKQKLRRDMACLLEALYADAQVTLSQIIIVRDCIKSRPSYQYFKAGKEQRIDKLLRIAKNEEAFIRDFVGQLSDKTYISLLPNLIKMSNRRMLEKIISAYTQLSRVKFGLQISTDDELTPSNDNEKFESYKLIISSDVSKLKSLSELELILKNLQIDLKKESSILRNDVKDLNY